MRKLLLLLALLLFVLTACDSLDESSSVEFVEVQSTLFENLWSLEVGSEVVQVIANEKYCIALLIDGRLIKIDANNGEVVDESEPLTEKISRYHSDFEISENFAVVNYESHKIAIVELDTMEFNTVELKTDDMGSYSNMIILRDNLYLTKNDEPSIYCFSLDQSRFLWSKRIDENDSRKVRLVGAKDKLYMLQGLGSKSIYEIDPSSGSVINSFEFATVNKGIRVDGESKMWNQIEGVDIEDWIIVTDFITPFISRIISHNEFVGVHRNTVAYFNEFSKVWEEDLGVRMTWLEANEKYVFYRDDSGHTYARSINDGELVWAANTLKSDFRLSSLNKDALYISTESTIEKFIYE